MLDFKQPPFTLGGDNPFEVGQNIARLYQSPEPSKPRVAEIWSALFEALRIDRNDQQIGRIFCAGLELAKSLDQGEGVGIQGGYHNTAHYVEVALNTAHLLLRNNTTGPADIVLRSGEQAEALFAALGHDYFYEAGGYKNVPYRLEKISLHHLLPLLRQHKVRDQSCRNIGVMLLATDVGSPSRAGSFLRLAHRFLFENGLRPEATKRLKPVQILLKRPRLTRQAAIISDADLLSSAGLTYPYTVIQRHYLGAELKKDLGPQGTLDFFDNIMKNRFITPAARFFQPVMDSIRQQAEAELNAAQHPAARQSFPQRTPDCG